MGESPSATTPRLGISREDQDAFSARSHQRAAEAAKNGLFDDEIVPVEIPQRKGDPVVFTDRRGHPRRHHRRSLLGKLRPAFAKDGTITAGSSSQISDGAAAVVVMSRAKAEELGLTWLAEIGAHGVVAGPDASLQSQPRQRDQGRAGQGGASTSPTSTWSRSTRRSRRVGIQSMRELGLDQDKVNVNGGAIALGHPIGMSGARLVLTSRSSSSGAAAASARRPSAAAAARATRSSCACLPPA